MKFIKSNISRTIFKVEGCKKFIFTDLAARSLETFRKSALPRKMIHFLAPQSITGIVSLYGGEIPSLPYCVAVSITIYSLLNKTEPVITE